MRVWKNAQGRCEYCGELVLFEDFTIDHIFPRDLGGSNQIGNLACACHPCNQSKSNLLVSRWRIPSEPRIAVRIKHAIAEGHLRWEEIAAFCRRHNLKVGWRRCQEVARRHGIDVRGSLLGGMDKKPRPPAPKKKENLRLPVIPKPRGRKGN